ncbi:hypothetical protein HA402_008780 [Bradysia odoriphaga]|nr:hypothetical protein HA402_008780 [Bradysia odoriphaga]
MTQQERPTSMKSLSIEKYCKPEEFQILDFPVPKISGPNDVLIKVNAASINPIDMKIASGMAKMIWPQTFPYKIGFDVSGIIVDVSPEVLALNPDLKQGTEVFSRVPVHCHGTVAEYALSTVSATVPIPRTLSHIEAASIPLASLTSLQVLDRADAALDGGLKGKTVFIAGGLAGTSSMAIQLAKNVFKVGKIITTVSTAKVSKVEELLGKNVVDQIIDYTKEDPARVIPSGSVDFMFDTMGQATALLKILKKGAVIVSVSGIPFGPDLKKGTPDLPMHVECLLSFLGGITKFRAWCHGVSYSYLFMEPNASDLARLSQYIDDGMLKPVVGRVAKFENLQEVRAGCQEVYTGKGGIGKFVIEVNNN